MLKRVGKSLLRKWDWTFTRKNKGVKQDAEAGNLLNLAEILETNNVDDRYSKLAL